MKAIDMTKIYRDYKGKWVAMKSPEDRTVVASGLTLKKIPEEAKKEGYDHPVVMRIPKAVIECAN